MATIPGSLSNLVTRLGLAGGKLEKADGKPGEKEAKGLQKGEALGEGALLAGVGYNTQDKPKVPKNAAEKENVARFLKDPEPELKALREKTEPEKPAEAKETPKSEAQPQARERADAKEAKEAQRDAQTERKEEPRADTQDARQREAQDAQTRAPELRRDPQEESSKERHRQNDDDDTEPGGDETPEVFGDVHRCEGLLTDGSRCLRKPDKNQRYCPEHRAFA
ncbi:MAG: hypothetical protein HYV07_21185 [Deltaproteobacteria bacterium]|nr:hypothetical protein [Deltaproteobacteria bacterium]